jgi:DNA-K related protein
LWKLINAPPKVEPGKKVVTAPRPAEGGADWWIMWRRVAGGLNTPLQSALYGRMKPVLLPAKGKMVVKPPPNELAEMWRTVASLERLDVKQKEQLGTTLLKTLRRSPVPTYGFFALTRFGARKLFYGPLNAVVHPDIVQQWLDAILAFEPGHQSERVSWLFCLAQLARRCGQRALDIDDSHRASVLKLLHDQGAAARLVRGVEEVVELAGEEQRELFGESLPIGLRLLGGEAEISP